MKGLARRWIRVLLDATWPEILRRYMKALHANPRAASKESNGDDKDEKDGLNEEESAPETVGEHQAGAEEDLDSGPVYVSEEDMLTVSEQQFAKFICGVLEHDNWWKLPPSAHLRLLNMLCYDIAQGYALRNDINIRLQDLAKLQADRAKEEALSRKQKRWVASLGDKGGKRRKKGGKGSQQQPSQEDEDAPQTGGDTPNNQQDQPDLGEDRDFLSSQPDGDGTTEGGIGDPEKKDRDAEYEVKLAERAFRTEVLGLDRYHKRYWWLRGTPGYVFVESSDGGSMGAITNEQQLDEVCMCFFVSLLFFIYTFVIVVKINQNFHPLLFIVLFAVYGSY